MIEYKMKDCLCPVCKSNLNQATLASGQAERNKPELGDATICINCGAILVFSVDLSVHYPNADEIKFLQSNPNQWAIMMQAQSLIKARGRIRP